MQPGCGNDGPCGPGRGVDVGLPDGAGANPWGIVDGDDIVAITNSAKRHRYKSFIFTGGSLTHFNVIDMVFWCVGFLVECAVFLTWCRSNIWRPLFMLGIYAGVRVLAEIVMFSFFLEWPRKYEHAAWIVFGVGYILMALVAVQVSEINRLNRNSLFFKFYCMSTTTAILIGIAGVLHPIAPTVILLRLARFADGVCLLNLVPSLRRTMPRPYKRLALVLMSLLAADFICSQWQALDGWKHWNLIARVYSAGQLAGWTALLLVLRAGRSRPGQNVAFYRPSEIADRV